MPGYRSLTNLITDVNLEKILVGGNEMAPLSIHSPDFYHCNKELSYTFRNKAIGN